MTDQIHFARMSYAVGADALDVFYQTVLALGLRDVKILPLAVSASGPLFTVTMCALKNPVMSTESREFGTYDVIWESPDRREVVKAISPLPYRNHIAIMELPNAGPQGLPGGAEDAARGESEDVCRVVDASNDADDDGRVDSDSELRVEKVQRLVTDDGSPYLRSISAPSDGGVR